MEDRLIHLKLTDNAAASIDAYREYKLIVGDDDGGKMFTPEEYEEYKKKVLPKRMMNRLYTSWTNENGMDCKLIGPETLCFCDHRYKEHKTDFKEIPKERPIALPCKVKNCRCTSYHYVPKMGSTSIRCTCKHNSSEHDVKYPYKCKISSCKNCQGFKSSYACACGQKFDQHKMVVETRDERMARGHPVGMDVPYQAMGGVTGFSSMMDGYCRLDPSGAGAPDHETLNKPISANDHPFLRNTINTTDPKSKMITTEATASLRQPGESELDYYERRYQEKLKEERLAKRNNVENRRLKKLQN